jgi:predicted RNase H-like HicB family nuclease
MSEDSLGKALSTIDSGSAYSPDLPGCVAAATSGEELRVPMTKAIEFHIEGLKLHGQPVPEPTTSVDYVTVAA